MGRLYVYGTCFSVVGQQLRFSLYSGAVMTKALAVVVSLYYLLVSGSVEYPMPYASCLRCCGVVALLCQLVLQLSLSSCVLLKGALLVQSFGLLQPLLFSAYLQCTLG